MQMQRMIEVSVATAALLAAVLPTEVCQSLPYRPGQSPAAQNIQSGQSGVERDAGAVARVDAHAYRHCHYIHTRVYCHKRDRLPMNWPPNTDTPHGSTYENPSGPLPPAKKGHAS